MVNENQTKSEKLTSGVNAGGAVKSLMSLKLCTGGGNGNGFSSS